MSIPTPVEGIAYGVETRNSEYGDWTMRYGMFPEVPEGDWEQSGLDRARENYVYAAEDFGAENARIVKVTTKKKVLD